MVDASAPASPRDAMTIYRTGLRAVNPPAAAGALGAGFATLV
jgi:uncharacterized protein (TIGR03437 family)